MSETRQAAVCIVCAPLPSSSSPAAPGRGRHLEGRDDGQPRTTPGCVRVGPAERDDGRPVAAERPGGGGEVSLNVSWYGSLRQLESSSEVPLAALSIDEKTAASRRSLRGLLRAARRAIPDLRAAVLPETQAVSHADLLVEEGIAVVLTSRFGGTGRPRRPAPPDWPCRNVQWGLWELLRHGGDRGGWLFRRAGLPRLRPGMLVAVDAVGTTGGTDAGRLRRIATELSGRLATGRVITPPLASLPEIICSNTARRPPGSILRAA